MKTSDKIIGYIEKNGQVTGSELVDYLGIKLRAVQKQLKNLMEGGQLTKSGTPPKVYYSIPTGNSKDNTIIKTPKKITKEIIDDNFFYITPRGTTEEGWGGFIYWCQERSYDPIKMADRYQKTIAKFNKYKKNGLIDGMYKMKSTFKDVALEEVFYIDFYSIEIFGKTKLGQMLLFAKQSQDRKLINDLADLVKPTVDELIKKFDIDGVGFIPPTVKRELQLIRQIQKRLDLKTSMLAINKIRTPIVVPQKTLNKIDDRIVNAKETITVDAKGVYHNILLIDDAVGSGSTLNETAKKIKQKGICSGKIIGLAITGSFKGFEVISEV